jgi:hypothetical protein
MKTRKNGFNPRWDKLAGAALRARTTLRLILTKTLGQPDAKLLNEIRDLAAEGSADLQAALKHPRRFAG